MWARKRHRGGGGLAVPGPFDRIARAGGQKVTIRNLKRPVFPVGSNSDKNYFQDVGGRLPVRGSRLGKTGNSTV